MGFDPSPVHMRPPEPDPLPPPCGRRKWMPPNEMGLLLLSVLSVLLIVLIFLFLVLWQLYTCMAQIRSRLCVYWSFSLESPPPPLGFPYSPSSSFFVSLK